MKSFAILPALAVFFLCMVANPLIAEEPSTATMRTRQGEAGGSQSPKKEPDLRVEVMMVAAPLELALAVLPDLKDPEKIDAAAGRLLTAVAGKKATLTGYPVVPLQLGIRAVAETISEHRYPTEYDPPPANPATNAGPGAANAQGASTSPVPTTFETRNTGVTLEVEAFVQKSSRGPDGKAGEPSILLNLNCQRVVFKGYEKFVAVEFPNGESSKVEQPLFAVNKIVTSMQIVPGKRYLLAVHNAIDPEDQLEFFILQTVMETP